jgi:hydroxyethylthiazole kinase-like uncharacterized protein yjeF
MLANAPALWLDRFPWPAEDAHKHSRGRLGVVSGGALSTGAARLAARAGLRIGAGWVEVFCPPEAAPVLAAALEAPLVRVFDGDADLERQTARLDAVVIGPAAGATEATKANLRALERNGAALVVDADALTVFATAPDELFVALDRDDVLTPHAGEFERLFPGLLAEAGDRVDAARRAAERAGAVVLLKGPETAIAAPDGRTALNRAHAPWLATLGTGDVLAGLIGGLLAQGMEGFDAACAAVWIHAEAARGFGPGLIAEDLPDLVPAVLRALRAAKV